MASGLAASPRHKLLGLGFIAVVGAGLYFLVLIFQKNLPWQHYVPLHVEIVRAGTQLNADADVKIRGLIVGRVKSQTAHGPHATLNLAITPRDIHLIPANVLARILPKTLFGEKYVELVVPEGETVRTAGAIKPGATIHEDRTQAALEVERVLADLFPLLRSLQPEKVNRTLNAVATALQGRGRLLGQNLEHVDTYLAGLEPHLNTITDDISGFADLASSLNENAPDLLAIARNTAYTSRTITAKGDALAIFLRGTAGFTDTFSGVLTDNEKRLIYNAAAARKQLDVLAARRGVLPGAVKGLNDLVVKLNIALGQGPYLNIRLESVPNRGTYTPADCPRYPGPASDPAATGSNCPDGAAPGTARTSAAAHGGSVGSVGSPEEKVAVRRLLGQLLGDPNAVTNDLVDLLAGPILRPLGLVP